MPEVREAFREATRAVGPDPGALERQFRRQRRRSSRRKTQAVALVGLLAIAAVVVVVRAARVAEDGGHEGPAKEGVGQRELRLDGVGLGFSADGTRSFSRGAGRIGYVYAAATGDLLQIVEAERGESVVAFSPDGSLFVSVRGCGRCDQQSPVAVLDTWVNETSTGRALWHLSRACCFAVFSPDGSRVALPYDGGTRVLDARSGELVDEFGLFGTIAFSPDGGRIAISSGAEGVVARVFDLDDPQDGPAFTIRGETSGDPWTTELAWSPDDSVLVSQMNTREAVVWDADTGARRFAISSPSGRFTSVAFGADPSTVATGSGRGTAIVWNLAGGAPEPVFTGQVEMGDRCCLTVALDPGRPQLMATGGASGTTLWRFPTS